MEMKGAIFDMDGLLFDTENIYQETWNELAAENGVTLGIDFVGDIRSEEHTSELQSLV